MEKGMTMAEFLQSTTQEQRNEIYNASTTGNTEKVKQLSENIGNKQSTPSAITKRISGTNTLDAQKPFLLNSYDTRSLGSSMKMYNHYPEAVRSLQNSMDFLKDKTYKQAIQDMSNLDQLNEQYKYSYQAYERAQKEADKAKKKNKTAVYNTALAEANSYKDTADKLRQRIVIAGGTPWEPFSVSEIFKGEDVRSTEGLNSEQKKSYLDLLKQFDELNNNAAYITTTEQSDEYERQRSDILSQLDEIDREAGRGVRAYDPRQRTESFFKSWGQGTAAGYLNAAASVDELSDSAEEMQRDIYELNRQIKKARVNYNEAVKAYGEDGAEPEKNILADLQKRLDEKREQYYSMEKPDTTKRNALYERADKELLSSQENMARAKSGASKLGTFGIDAAKTMLDIGLDTATSFVGVPGLANMAVRVYGSEAQDARLNGDDAQTAAAKGLKSALIEVLTEKIGGPFEKAYGSTALGKLTDKAISKLSNKGVIEFITEALGEGVEEGMSDVLNIVVDHIAGWDDGSKNVIQDLAANGDEMLYDIILGAAVGAVGATGEAINEKYLTPEQKAVAEETQKKLEAKADTPATQSAAATPATLSTSQTDTSTPAVANVAQNASESSTTNAGTKTSTDTTPAQNYSQKTIEAKAAALGEMPAIYNGTEARVTAMVKMDNGKYAAQIEYNTSKGTKEKQVTEDKLTFNAETKRLMDMFRPYEYSNQMLFNYDAQKDGGENLAAYTMAFNTVADILGKQTTLSEEAAKQYVQSEPGLASALNEAQITAAFRAGRESKDAQVQSSVTRKGGTGKLVFGKSITAQGVQYQAATEDMVSQAEREVLQTVAKAAGVDIFFYQSEEAEGRYQGANGFYRNGTVYLDVNAGAERTTEQSAILLTAAHELTHYLRENNAEGYAELRDFVTTHLIQDGTDIVTLAEQKIRSEGAGNYTDFTLEDAIEEVVADSCEMMLENTQLPQIMAQENPNLYSKVRNWLRSFIENLRRAFEGVTARSPEARAMMQYAGELQQIWDNALADTASKPREKRSGKGNAKFSFRGKNAEGIEVYETSEETKALPYSERKKKYIELMRNQYRGRTAKFEHNGQVDYALFSDDDVRKDMYGDKRSDRLGQNAKINIGADGNIFELVENAKYVDSKEERGKESKAHKNVAEWDYYIKTVKIDGRTYNVLANIRKTKNNAFVYSIQMNESKSIEAVPPQKSSFQNGIDFQNRANTASNSKRISQLGEEVNSKFSKRERDNEYMKAANAGDTETAQRLVDEAASEAGYNIHAYHGTKRADRVGTQFIPERSTSGPMAFFTSDPNIAANYARDKADTSLAYDEEYTDYYSQFRVNRNGESKAVQKLWTSLPYADKQRIKEAGKHITWDEDMENIIWSDEATRGLGNWDSYTLNEHKGNAIEALIDSWLESGELFGHEADFLTVLKLAGIEDVEYRDPEATYEKVYDTYLRLQNPFNTADVNEEFIESFETWASQQPKNKYSKESASVDMWDKNSQTAETFAERMREDISKGTSHAWTSIPDIMTDYLKSLGYDGIQDVGGKNGGDSHTVYIPFSGEQVKTTEPITYDANGDIIPLSERFNPTAPDIRFSRRTSDDTMTKEEAREQQQSRAELLRENEALRQRVEYWKGQTQLTKEKTVRNTDTHKFARDMADKLDVKNREAVTEFEEAAQHMGDYIVQSTGETLDYDTLHTMATEAADILLTNSEVEIESGMEEQLGELADYIKTHKLKVNETELNDLPEGWQRQHRRFIKLSPDGTPIDVAWQEWQEQFGEGLFPADITAQSDMLQRLADIEQGWKTYKANPFEHNMAEMRETVAQEIIDTMLSDEIRQTAPTAADRAKAKADKRYSDMRQAERQRANERVAKVLAEGKQRTADAVKAERTFQLQRQERVQKTKSIQKLRDRMIKSLTDNTGKNHVPDILKEPVAQLLQSIDPTTKYTRQAGTMQYIESLEKLERVMEEQRKHSFHTLDATEAEGTGADLFFDIPVDFSEQIKDYVDNVKHWSEFSKATTFKLQDMSLQELSDLENILRVVRGAISNVNELYGMSTTASELGNETISYLSEMKEKTKANNIGEKFLGFSNQTPVYYFERFGEAGKKVMKSLTDGWDKFAFYTDEILSFAKTLYSTKEVLNAERDIRIVQLHDTLVDGLTDKVTVPVSMTRAQIMCLYGAVRRGETSLNHILGAGIRLSEIKNKQGKSKVQPKTYLFKDIYELAQIINDNLTARDKAIVDGMIKFMSGPVAKWGNAVSQERWGIDLFTEETYWPLITTRDSHAIANSDSAGASTSIYRLMNMGFTKKLKPNANNPVVIGSAFDVFANHTSDMAKYGSMVLPILNTMKWINYSSVTGNRTLDAGAEAALTYKAYSQYTTVSVRKSMDSIYGHEAEDYLVQLLRDINGQSGGIKTENMVDTLTSNYKRQAVAANLRVALLQPTSIMRAFHVLDPNGLSMDTLRSFAIKKNYEEAKANSGIALWKNMGFYDTNINASVRKQIKHDETFIENLVDKSMFLAEKGDQLTWSILWGASRHQVKQEAAKAGQKLTHEELMQKTNDLFTTVIYKTQVVDSPLTRSQLMRSNDKLSKALTAFMAEPTLSYNVLAENVHEFARETSAHDIPTAWKKCGKKILRSLAIYSASSILTAAAASLADAGRDDDEYKKLWEKWLEKFKGEESFWDSNIWAELNPLTKLPVIKDICNLLAGQTSSSMWLEGFDSAYSAVKSIYERIGEKDDLLQLEMKDWQVAYRGLKAVSQLAGLPLMTFTRDAIALWNTTGGAFTGKYIHNYDYDQEKAIRNAYRGGYLDEDEVMNLLMDKDTMGDKVYFTEHAARVKIADWTNDSIEAMYDSLYTAMENNDRAGFDAAMESLVEDGKRYHYDVIGNVRSTIKEWYIGDERGAYKLNKDMAVDMLTDYGGYTTDDAKKTVHQWTCEKVEGFSFTNQKEMFLLGDITRDEAIKLVMAYGKDDDGNLLSEYKDTSAAREAAEKEVQTWQMALDTKIDYEKIRSAYDSGEISYAELEKYLVEYGGMEEESAENKAYLWQWKEGDAKLNSITSAQARRYDNYIAGAGVDITKEQYANFIDGKLADKFHGDLKPGSTNSYVPYSKRNKIWEYIDSLPLTPDEKDAMAVVYAYDYDKDISENSSYFKLQEAPWNN